MKYIALFFSLVTFLMAQIHTAVALDIPVNIQVSDITQNSISVDWDDVEGSLGYVISYGTDASNLNLGGEDVLSTSSGSLTDLQPETLYTLQVIAFDESASEFESEPFSFTTLPTERDPLSLESITVVYDNEVSFQFNTAIDESVSSNGIFSIRSLETDTEILVQELIRDQIDPTQVYAIFETPLLPAHQYEAIVIDVQDIYNRSIELGVDGIENFSSPEVFASREEVIPEELNAAEITSEKAPTDEKVADEVETNSLAGQEIAEEDIAKNAASVGSDAESLPDTGAEHALLFILALIFSTLVFVYKFRKA